MNNLINDIENVLRYLNDQRLRTGNVEYLHLTHALSVLYTDYTHHNHLCLKLKELDLANYKTDRGYYLVQMTQKSIDIMNDHGSYRKYLYWEELRRLEAINNSIPAKKPRHIAIAVKEIVSVISRFIIKHKKAVISSISAIGLLLLSLFVEYDYFIPRQEEKSAEKLNKESSKSIPAKYTQNKVEKNDTLNRKKIK